MLKKHIIIYYGKEPKAPRVFFGNETKQLLEEIVRLTKLKALFAVYEIGECVGDFS